MSVTINVTLIRRLIHLLKEYSKSTQITPAEFINKKIDIEISEANKKIYDSFLTVEKYREFFEVMVHKFWKYYDLKSFNKEVIISLMYTIVFELDEESLEDVNKIFLNLSYKFCYHVIEYFTVEDNLVEVTQAGCKYFDNSFVLQKLLYPLLNKKEFIQTLCSNVGNAVKIRNTIESKPATKATTPAFLQKQKPSRRPIDGTVQSENNTCKRCHLSKYVLLGDKKTKNKLDQAHDDNKAKAKKLFEFAQDNAFSCANYEPKVTEEEEVRIAPIKPTKLPSKKEVAIKHNTASLMREAATLVKDRVSEMKKIEALTETLFDPTPLENLENDIRKCKEQQHMQNIERKHLQGLLTREEALLAKQNLLKLNQKKMEEFKDERVAILQEIDRWRFAEQEKIKALVERCQNIEKAAKDAGKKMIETKKYKARLIEQETRQLLHEACAKKQEELARKVKLIQELRALHQVRTLQVKEFDPTETPNFGLFCEMSIAELQERLYLLKNEMKEELEQRRKYIAAGRMQQQKLMEDVKKFIDHSRITKPKQVPRAPPELEQTPEILALRERLQQVRLARFNTALDTDRFSFNN